MLSFELLFTLFLATLCLFMLCWTFANYAPYRKQNVPYLNTCLIYLAVSFFQPFAGVACLLLPQGPLFETLTYINGTWVTLTQTMLIQIIFMLIGYNDARSLRYLRCLYILPVLSAICSLTNGLHHQYVVSIYKLANGFGYVVESGWISYVISIVSALLVLIALFFSMLPGSRKSSLGSTRVRWALLAALLTPNLANALEFLFPSMQGMHSNLYFMWTATTIIFNVYFGYLRTARNSAIHIMNEAYFVFDIWGNSVDTNNAAKEFFARFAAGNEESQGTLADLLHVHTDTKLDNYEFSLLNAKGEEHFFNANTFALNGNLSQYCGTGYIVREITSYKLRMKQLDDLANIDPLTGARNRRYLYEYAETLIPVAAALRMPVTLLMLDIDFFKKVNDTYGHAVGDIVLKELCEICRQNLRRSEILCRYGGEEFVIVSEDTGIDEGRAMAERIREALRAHTIQTEAGDIHITVSIGGCTFIPEKDDAMDTWIQIADQQLYKAKETGRDRVCYDLSNVAAAEETGGV